jgi:hypothetical protein
MSLHLNLSTGKFLNSSTLFKLSDALLLDVSSGEIVMSNLLVPRAGVDLFKLASLDLNFAQRKSLTDRVSGNNLVTFRRASSGTYVDSDGLIKTSPVNLLTYSNEFTNNAWTKSNLNLVSLTHTAPDGTATATTFSTTNTAYIYQDAGSVIGQPYVNSIWIKGNANATLGLRKPALNNPSTAIGSDGTKSINVTTEWQRFTAVTTSADSTVSRLLVDLRAMNGASIPAGFELSLWHAQTEEGSTATDYIPTGATISGAPRFDHDPVTGKSLGLLIEESRTNLINYSANVNNVWWTKSQLATPILVSSVNNPLENADAYRVRSLATLDRHQLHRSQSDLLSDATDYTFSVLAAPEGTGADSGKLQLRINQILGNSGIVNFDLNTGQKNAQDGLSGTSDSGTGWEIHDYGMDPYPNGWYRVWMTFQLTGSTCSVGIVNIDNINASDASGIHQYTGSGTGGYYVASIQVEAGPFKTSVIPTSGSTVTRAADVASITGTNFTSFYNQSEGTVFVDTQSYPHPVSGKALVPFAFSDNSYSNRVTLAGSTGSSQFNFDVVTGGAQQRAILGNFSSSGLKAAGGYKSTGSAGSLNGATAVTANSPNIPSVISQLNIGQAHDGNNTINGHISRLAYFPTRKTDQELIDLTT